MHEELSAAQAETDRRRDREFEIGLQELKVPGLRVVRGEGHGDGLILLLLLLLLPPPSPTHAKDDLQRVTRERDKLRLAAEQHARPDREASRREQEELLASTMAIVGCVPAAQHCMSRL